MDDDAREALRQRRIADACLGSGTAPDGRLALYRRLVQTNLAGVARRILPRTAKALDEASAGAFDAWFARFLAERAPRTPYLRDVPVELVAWAAPLWARDADVPPFVRDLATYESDLFSIAWAPRAASSPTLTEVSLDRPLVFASPFMLAAYAHVVEGPDPPLARPTRLLIHRDEDNTVQSTLVDPDKAPLLSLLCAGVPLGEALARAPGLSAADLAPWLAALGEAGALLGGGG